MIYLPVQQANRPAGPSALLARRGRGYRCRYTFLRLRTRAPATRARARTHASPLQPTDGPSEISLLALAAATQRFDLVWFGFIFAI